MRFCVVDRDRVLAKLNELESYLGELRAVAKSADLPFLLAP
jgi:hypothetical protein